MVQKVNQKPDKPYRDFPLFAHANGQWAKKIRGKLHYFGQWGSPDDALALFLHQQDDLYAGRSPRTQDDSRAMLRDVVNHFLTSKQQQIENGELSYRSFADYERTCRRLIVTFSKNRIVEELRPLDFKELRIEISKTRGHVALGNEIQRVRTIFKYAYEAELIDKPVRFGPDFKKPSRKLIRQARNERGPRMYEAAEVRTLLNAAESNMKAMILLGINCGFGQTNVANLTASAIDFDNFIIDYPRQKTAVQRRCPIWPETAEALQSVIQNRPTPKSDVDSDIIFITKYGHRWVRASDTAKRSWTDAVQLQFGKLIRKLDLHKPRFGFYTLRHTHETIAGESTDQVAVDFIMGHARDDMASIYRERIGDERLQKVVNHVHAWLFPLKVSET